MAQLNEPSAATWNYEAAQFGIRRRQSDSSASRRTRMDGDSAHATIPILPRQIRPCWAVYEQSLALFPEVKRLIMRFGGFQQAPSGVLLATSWFPAPASNAAAHAERREYSPPSARLLPPQGIHDARLLAFCVQARKPANQALKCANCCKY